MSVLSVDYRLCNDGILFPAPHNDSLEALRWLAAHAQELSIDPRRIFIGGISAGGALAAALAIQDRDLGLGLVCGQLLSCPLIHKKLPALSTELHSTLDEVSGPWFTPEMIQSLTNYLCDGQPETAPTWWFAGDDLVKADLPPTQIINCEYDSLRASGEEYARQLLAAGVEVEVSFEPGTPHAHLNRLPADCEPTDRTLSSMARFILER